MQQTKRIFEYFLSNWEDFVTQSWFYVYTFEEFLTVTEDIIKPIKNRKQTVKINFKKSKNLLHLYNLQGIPEGLKWECYQLES